MDTILMEIDELINMKIQKKSKFDAYDLISWMLMLIQNKDLKQYNIEIKFIV